MQLSRTFIPAALLVLIDGCAADQIKTPASTIGHELSNYQATLASFSDDLKVLRNAEASSSEGMVARSNVYTTAAKQMQVEWAIAHAKTEGEVFALLQQQGDDEASRIARQTPATPVPTAPSLPLDQLGTVAIHVTALSKASGTKADLELLIGYATAVNTKLKALEGQAKK